MKSNIWKSTFREIKQSFGRFMAIFAITALGVSLFSGLKVLQPAMVKTTDKYFMEKELYDYRVMSNMGFEEPDLEFLASQEEVRIAEGIVSFDMLCYMEGESEKVIQIYNVPERMNNLELLYGRMPKSSKECIVDSAMYGEDALGKKICLSVDNDEDDLENFSVKEYEVVGVAQSSNYIQFERGNTSKGNGKIAGFMYIPEDAFDVGFYTEILVKFDEDYQIYSDEYDSYMDEKEPVWEKIAEEAAKNRHERIVAEATEELEDAKKEFAEEKADAEAELEDARIELADAYKELTDADKEIADAKKELADGWATFEENKKTLDDAGYEIGYNLKVKLPNAEEEIEKNKKLLAGESAKLRDAQAQIDAGRAQIPLTREQIDGVKFGLSGLRNSLEAYQPEQDTTGAILIELNKQAGIVLGPLQGLLQPRPILEETPIQSKEQLLQQIEIIDEVIGEMDEGLAALESAQMQLDDGKEQISDAKHKLEEAEKEIADAYEEIEKGLEQWEDGMRQLSEGEAELLKGEAELADAEKELADG